MSKNSLDRRGFVTWASVLAAGTGVAAVQAQQSDQKPAVNFRLRCCGHTTVRPR